MKLTAEAKTIFKVIAEDLELLALLHDKEPGQELLDSLKTNQFPHTLGLALVSENSGKALDLMQQGLSEIDATDTENLNLLAADYAGIYLNNSFNASPYESVWLDEDNLMMQDAMFEVRKWYKQYNLMAPNWRTRSDDHLVHQFRFISHILKMNKIEHLTKLTKFMDEHLFRWFDKFAARVANRCDTNFYAGLATLSFCYIDEVRDLLSQVLVSPRPSKEEVEARFVKTATESSVQYIPGASVSW